MTADPTDAMTPEARQLALPFDWPERFDAEDFIDAPSNAAARAALVCPESWVENRLVLWGEPGCGKSHLAAMWAAKTGARSVAAWTLRSPLTADAPGLVIEDIDAVDDETALLGTIERARHDGLKVLLTSRVPPARLDAGLADLASRLRASLTIRIEPPDDALLDALLHRLAARRQLHLPAPLRQFLLRTLPRRPATLREAVARLDRASLATGRKLSRPLAEPLLADLTDPPEAAAPSHAPVSVSRLL